MKRRHKYGAVPTIVDGIRFASKAEAKRYADLKVLERAGFISELECQPAFVLNAADGDCTPVGKYVADFAYYDNEGRRIVEDVKGVRTPLYRWKKKHVEAQYGIEIREVRA